MSDPFAIRILVAIPEFHIEIGELGTARSYQADELTYYVAVPGKVTSLVFSEYDAWQFEILPPPTP